MRYSLKWTRSRHCCHLLHKERKKALARPPEFRHATDLAIVKLLASNLGVVFAIPRPATRTSGPSCCCNRLPGLGRQCPLSGIRHSCSRLGMHKVATITPMATVFNSGGIAVRQQRARQTRRPENVRGEQTEEDGVESRPASWTLQSNVIITAFDRNPTYTRAQVIHPAVTIAVDPGGGNRLAVANPKLNL